MLLKELQNQEPISKRVITFAKDGNTVIKPYKKLVPLTGIEVDTNLYLEFFSDNYGLSFNLYDELSDNIIIKIGFNIRCSEDKTLKEFQANIYKYPYFGKNGFIKRIMEYFDNGTYINLCEIETLKGISEFELAQKAIDYRAERIKIQEQKYAEEDKQRRERYEKEKEERQKEIDDQVARCIDAVRNKKEYRNEDLISGERTVVLQAMKEKGIKIPIKTQGWINKALSRICFENGEITYRYYSKHKDSSVFYKYLVEFQEAL